MADQHDHAVLLAAPVVELITPHPEPEMLCDLGINWPLEPSRSDLAPARRES
jgi:hypothetical protein